MDKIKTNAELKLPEFDEKQLPKIWNLTDVTNDPKILFTEGARWQFQECAKVLAARDAEIEKLKAEYRDILEPIFQKNLKKVEAERDIYLKALTEYEKASFEIEGKIISVGSKARQAIIEGKKLR